MRRRTAPQPVSVPVPFPGLVLVLLLAAAVSLRGQRPFPGDPGGGGAPAGGGFGATAAELGGLAEYSRPGCWRRRRPVPAVDRAGLVRAVEGIRAYYLNQQRPAGDFLYAMDITDGGRIDDNNQVRQAGALWGLACLNRDRFTEATRKAVMMGLNFFIRSQRELPTGERILAYPGEKVVRTGCVALYCLAVVEFIRGQEGILPEVILRRYRDSLDSHLAYLRNMEMPDGSWAEEYDLQSGYRVPRGSPYYDGEALLAYARAARHLGHRELVPRIERAAPRLLKKYTLDCWRPGQMDDACKGFSQWGCLAIAEYAQAGWKDAEILARGALAIAWWLIEYDKVECRNGNTGYAVEGLLAAWQVARFLGDREAMNILERTSRRILGRLLTLQVDGPYSKGDPFVERHRRRMPPTAAGGVLAAPGNGVIRIDNVQHQLHAMLMMLRLFFPAP